MQFTGTVVGKKFLLNQRCYTKKHWASPVLNSVLTCGHRSSLKTISSITRLRRYDYNILILQIILKNFQGNF